jgi:putative membrane protein
MRNRNILIVILAVVGVVLLLGLAWAVMAGTGMFGYRYGPGMMGGWGYGMMGGGIMMFLIWLPLLVGAGALVWYFASSAQRGTSAPGREESPLDILKRRYARGEIDREEYERMRREIE